MTEQVTSEALTSKLIDHPTRLTHSPVQVLLPGISSCAKVIPTQQQQHMYRHWLIDWLVVCRYNTWIFVYTCGNMYVCLFLCLLVYGVHRIVPLLQLCVSSLSGWLLKMHLRSQTVILKLYFWSKVSLTKIYPTSLKTQFRSFNPPKCHLKEAFSWNTWPLPQRSPGVLFLLTFLCKKKKMVFKLKQRAISPQREVFSVNTTLCGKTPSTCRECSVSESMFWQDLGAILNRATWFRMTANFHKMNRWGVGVVVGWWV